MSTVQTSPAATAEVIDRVAADFRDIHVAAEEILFSLQPGQPLTSSQRATLHRAGFELSFDIERERGRVEEVKKWMAKAGSAQDLAAVDKAMTNAAREYQKQAPALLEKIAELTAQVANLRKVQTDAADRHNAFAEAREHLREMAPRFVKEAHYADIAAVTFPYRGRMAEIRGELDLLDALSRLDPSTREAELHIEAAAPELLRHRQKAGGIDPAAWSGYLNKRSAKRPALERELQELSSQSRAALDELNSSLDWYVNKLD